LRLKILTFVLVATGVCLYYLIHSINAADPGKSPALVKPVVLTLDWRPEPEFGGFYAAEKIGSFGKHGFDVDIKPAGEGSLWQLVATGTTDFATTAADQVIIARSQGADVIAFFAVYQTCPQGIMVHASRGFKSLEEVFTHDGQLLAEDNDWLHFLTAKYNPIKVTIGQYSGGISVFLRSKKNSQQCFVTSEPILAKQHGSDPQTFLVADAGYNPYTTVVICNGKLWREQPQRVKEMTAALREGWRAYLDDPTIANKAMGDLNKDMDADTFALAAEAQKPLIETAQTQTTGLGTMTRQRWQELLDQLQSVKDKDLQTPPKAEECFVNP